MPVMTRDQHGLPLNVHMVDLFAGPGGLDVAAQWLGVAADGIEWDTNACATRFEADLQTQPGDVREFNPKKFPDARILAGGPPCQTYTVAGSGHGRRALSEVVTAAESMASGEDLAELLTNLDERTRLVLEPHRRKPDRTVAMSLPTGPRQDVTGAGGEEGLIGALPGHPLVRPLDGGSAKRSSRLRSHGRNVPVAFPPMRGTEG